MADPSPGRRRGGGAGGGTGGGGGGHPRGRGRGRGGSGHHHHQNQYQQQQYYPGPSHFSQPHQPHQPQQQPQYHYQPQNAQQQWIQQQQQQQRGMVVVTCTLIAYDADRDFCYFHNPAERNYFSQIVIMDSATLNAVPPQDRALLMLPGTQIWADYINPANLKILSYLQIWPPSPQTVAQAQQAARFLEQQVERLESRVRQVLLRYQPNGISQTNFFVSYSITHGSSFGCDAQCLGYSVLEFADTWSLIEGVEMYEGDIEVWEKVPLDPQPASSPTPDEQGHQDRRTQKKKVVKRGLLVRLNVEHRVVQEEMKKLGNPTNNRQTGNYDIIRKGVDFRLPQRYADVEVFYTFGLLELDKYLTKAINDDRSRYKDSGCPVVVGLDTEWFPDLVPGLHSKTAVLQMAFSSTCFVISLIHLPEVSATLKAMLADPTIIKTGQEVLYDVERLEEQYGVEVKGLVDLKDIADSNRLPKLSLSDLYEHVTGEQMNKPRKVTMSNWEKRPLTPQQISYAALDGLVSREIFFGLHKMYANETQPVQQWLDEGDFLLDSKRILGEKSSRWNSELT